MTFTTHMNQIQLFNAITSGLLVTASFLASLPVKADNSEVHKQCLAARDYEGCIRIKMVAAKLAEKKSVTIMDGARLRKVVMPSACPSLWDGGTGQLQMSLLFM